MRAFEETSSVSALLHIQVPNSIRYFGELPRLLAVAFGCQEEVDEGDGEDVRELTTTAATVGIF